MDAPPDYFDDDDMIQDYIGDEFDEPPPPFEDDADWMEAEAAVANTKDHPNDAKASTAPVPSCQQDSSAAASANKDTGDMFMADDDDSMDEDDPPPTTSIRLDFAKKRRKQKDPFSFERYIFVDSALFWCLSLINKVHSASDHRSFILITSMLFQIPRREQ